MKPAKKPFIAQIKNPRRLCRGKNSIWEKVDLKAAGDQATAEQMAEEGDAAARLRPEPVAVRNAAEISA